VLKGDYVVGWARRASDGVVGRARLDAETGIKHVMTDLAALPPRPAAEAERVIAGVIDLLKARGSVVVSYADVAKIEAAERARATAAGVEEDKFRSNREMLEAIRDA
jgi:ferredoxin--NADP+ reductase